MCSLFRTGQDTRIWSSASYGEAQLEVAWHSRNDAGVTREGFGNRTAKNKKMTNYKPVHLRKSTRVARFAVVYESQHCTRLDVTSVPPSIILHAGYSDSTVQCTFYASHAHVDSRTHPSPWAGSGLLGYGSRVSGESDTTSTGFLRGICSQNPALVQPRGLRNNSITQPSLFSLRFATCTVQSRLGESLI